MKIIDLLNNIENDEIKEILDKFKRQIKNDLDYRVSPYQLKQLLDYITNLQQELEDYKSRNEKAVDYIKEHIKYECDDAFNGMQFYSHHLYDFSKDDLLNILNGKE